MRTLFERMRQTQWISNSSEVQTEELEAFIDEKADSSERRANRKSPILLWKVLTLLLTFATTALLFDKYIRDPVPGYLASDPAFARSAIEYEQVTYTGALVFDNFTGKAIRKPDSDVEYFGPPSARIERAWANLMRDRLMAFTEEEVKPYQEQAGLVHGIDKYIFEPDMFHNLHCIDTLRSVLSASLYPNAEPMHDHWENAGGFSKNDHIEHCLDRLRQSVMCHGDLTPSVFYSVPEASLLIGTAGQHTCRKFSSIKKWMEERAKKYPLFTKAF